MTLLNLQAQAPLTKTVNFNTKELDLGDSYQQRVSSEKVDITYSFTSAFLTINEKDYYQNLFKNEQFVYCLPHDLESIRYYKILNYSFSQIGLATFVCKIELKLMNESVCQNLVENINQLAFIAKNQIVEGWEFIKKYIRDAIPHTLDADFKTSRFFHQAFTNLESQRLHHELITSKDYYLAFLALLDIYDNTYDKNVVEILVRAVEQYNNNPLFLYLDAPPTPSNSQNPWLPNAAYSTQNIYFDKNFDNVNVRASGVLEHFKGFTNGVYTFPNSTKLSKCIKCFTGNMREQYLDTVIDTGRIYEIDYFIDFYGFLYYPDGFKASNNTGHPSNTIVLKDKTVTQTLKVNYTVLNDIQSKGTFYPYPIVHPVYNDSFMYYGYTSVFLMEFYHRIQRIYYNFRVFNSVRALEYFIPFIHNALNDALTFIPGISTTYCHVHNGTLTWYGYFYLFEQNENLWDIFSDEAKANNILNLKLAAMDNYRGKSIAENTWIFTPIYTSNRPDEPTDQPNEFIEIDGLAAVDNGYSLESQFNCICNTAEYLSKHPTNSAAQTIVNRWVDGIFAWSKRKKSQTEFRFKPPTLFYTAAENLEPSNAVGDSPYAAAMIIKAAIYANLGGVNKEKTIWLIQTYFEYLQTQYVNSANMKGTFTVNNRQYFGLGGEFKTLKMEHHYEIIRMLALLNKQKDFLNFPSCDVYESVAR